MQLNLLKCIFSVEARNFLSFLITNVGIKVNPKKVNVITQNAFTQGGERSAMAHEVSNQVK